ncbi:MAG: acyl-CoA thioesterase [Verrucomicrobiota bacterium]
MGEFSRFQSHIPVRPDDVDFNRHVRHSAYLDYVLAARLDQMERCYRMAMGEFVERGYSWVVKRTEIEYRRSLLLGQTALVETGIESIGKSAVQVSFEISELQSLKLAAKGVSDYTLVSIESGRPQVIPEDIVEAYSI